MRPGFLFIYIFLRSLPEEQLSATLPEGREENNINSS